MKAPTKAQVSLLTRLSALGFGEPSSPQPRTNPFSGATRTLTPLACKLYDFITARTLVCGRDYTRKDWDNARYMFMGNWSSEYMDLID